VRKVDFETLAETTTVSRPILYVIGLQF